MRLKFHIAIFQPADGGELEIIAAGSDADAVLAAYKEFSSDRDGKAYLVTMPEVDRNKRVESGGTEESAPSAGRRTSKSSKKG